MRQHPCDEARKEGCEGGGTMVTLETVAQVLLLINRMLCPRSFAEKKVLQLWQYRTQAGHHEIQEPNVYRVQEICSHEYYYFVSMIQINLYILKSLKLSRILVPVFSNKTLSENLPRIQDFGENTAHLSHGVM